MADTIETSRSVVEGLLAIADEKRLAKRPRDCATLLRMGAETLRIVSNNTLTIPIKAMSMMAELSDELAESMAAVDRITAGARDEEILRSEQRLAVYAAPAIVPEALASASALIQTLSTRGCVTESLQDQVASMLSEAIAALK